MSQDKMQTDAEVRNQITYSLTLGGSKVWKGDTTAKFPGTIDKDQKGKFTHLGGSEGGSHAAIVYKLQGDGKKLVIAWKNLKDNKNKVYTEITDQAVDWSDIKDKLNKEGSAFYETTKFGYHAEVDIDANGNSPNMTATIESSGVTMARLAAK
ncbi:hypothetical protein HRI_002994000 [Hibiscus trionum]|uniref:Uncharacterized protein n=1 Tax=Hibiscus trionum TaxID=183268 RepID=A0A9W7IDJ6_HIBTR|nr:hypothetical protein HRI_002994000 [Hibiscus trionum]